MKRALPMVYRTNVATRPAAPSKTPAAAPPMRRAPLALLDVEVVAAELEPVAVPVDAP